jgi:hypothetical protein
MIAIMKAKREKTEANIETGQKAREAKSKADLEEMEATDLEESPKEIESKAEHEVPKEEVIVETFGALKERYRYQHIAVWRHGQPKKQTQGNRGSWRKLAAIRRGMTRWAQAQHKGCGHEGPTVEQRQQKKQTRENVQGTRKGWTFEKRHQAKLECKMA